MLRDLTIKNYRCFKDFSIDGLARVNLIVGKNNSGKTSFLEAVYLLVNQQNPFSLLELLYNRGEYGEVFDTRREFDYQMAHIFHGHEPDLQQQPMICIESSGATPISVTARFVAETGFVNGASSAPYSLQFRYGEAGCKPTEQAVGGINLPIDYTFAFRHTFTPSARQPGPHQFVAARHIDYFYLAKLWNQIITTPEKEDRVVKGLQVVEPKVEDFRFTSQPTPGGILIKLKDLQTRLPLSSMGDGMRQILAIMMETVQAKDSVILIDEIDTGLYHEIQAPLWRLLIDTAEQLDMQIFATTHSWDCVQSFQEALEATDQSLGLLFRLDDRFGQIRPIKYEAGELAVAMREAIEVR